MKSNADCLGKVVAAIVRVLRIAKHILCEQNGVNTPNDVKQR